METKQSLDQKSTKQFIREMFSENDRGSSKRLVGFICTLVVAFCTTFLTVKDGSNDIVKDLIQTVSISSCALLGVSCVTGIFKKDKNGNQKETDQ